MHKQILSDLDMALINTMFKTIAKRLDNEDKALSAQLKILDTRDRLIEELSKDEHSHSLFHIFIDRISTRNHKLSIMNSIYSSEENFIERNIVINSDWSSYEIL